MKRQYMDFVPARRSPAKVEKKKISTTRVTIARASKPAKKSLTETTLVTEEKTTLGKVENLNTKFVKSDVPKRPLSQKSHFVTSRTGIAAVKAEKVGNKKPARAAELVEKPVEKSTNSSDKKVYKMPTSPFINQHKVQKRPLSKNVYSKKEVIPKEEPKGPVTIITKPEKQAHVGLIVTIILTIILGAAAGTVAFLLLPK